MPNQWTLSRDTKKNRLRQALLWQLGRVVTYESLEDVLWGDDEDGGPLFARAILHKQVMLLRRDGISIENFHGKGMRMRSYDKAE